MRVTLKDVAKAASVSIKTVSRVMNNQGEISEATRQHVQQTIDELGYQPNRLARALLDGKTNLIGIIIPDITDPFFTEFILSAENTARHHNYSIVLCNANRNPDQELQYINVLAEHQVDGFLIAGSRMDHEQLTGIIEKYKVAVLSPQRLPYAGSFTLDDYDGARELCRYILSLGHRKIGFLSRAWEGDFNNRFNGIADEYRAAGFSPDDIVRITTQDISVESGEKLTQQLVEQFPGVTAVLCYNDVLAIGGLRACLRMGKMVPKDLSIVGFDDIPEARRAYPALTTYQVDKTALGAAMMERLVQLIEDGGDGAESVIVQGRLVIRESCREAA